MSSDLIEKDIKELDSILHSELDRAIRVDSPLSVMFLKILPEKDIGQNVIYSLEENIRKVLRKIDSVLVYKRFVVLVLPLTNKSGMDVVRDKLGKALAETGINREDVYDRTFVFPDDVNKKELIKNFNIKPIIDLIMQVFHGMMKR